MLLRYESLGAKNVSKFFLHASHTSTPLPIMSSYSPAEELLPNDKMNKATKTLKDFIRAFSIVGGAERGAPASQSAYRRVCGAATPKGAAQRGCSATGPTPRATGAPAALGYAGAGPALGRTGKLTPFQAPC